jgi:hypothetical protein
VDSSATVQPGRSLGAFALSGAIVFVAVIAILFLILFDQVSVCERTSMHPEFEDAGLLTGSNGAEAAQRERCVTTWRLP